MTVEVREVAPADAAPWVALRSALWPEGAPDDHGAEVAALFAAPERGGHLPAAVFVAAEPWGRSVGCSEFDSDALVDNIASAAAHRALGFEEVGVIRCFRKSVAAGAAAAPKPSARGRLPEPA